MSFAELLHALRRGWLIVFAATVLGVAGSLAVTAIAVEKYSATTELFVSVQSSDSSTAGDIGQGNSAAQQKVRSYSEVAVSSRVLQPVIDKLHLATTPAALGRRISTTSPPNSVIINISASDTNPHRAAAIANAVGESFRAVVVDSLESPVGGGPGLVRIETIQPATSPASPSSPRLFPNVALGLLLGLAAGVGLAVLRSVLDTKIRSDRDAENAAGRSVIGAIGFDPSASKRPLIVQLDPHSPRAESFRSLRTNLQFLDAGTGTRTFLMTSAMPSEGKTTTVANLAIALAESGSSVLLVDADLRRPRVAEVMGLEGAVGLTDVLIGRAELDDVIQPWGSARLEVLPAGQIPPNPSELLGSRGMQALLETAAGLYEYVLIDTPPLLPVTDAAVLSKLTNGVILVTAAGRSRRPQVERASAALANIGTQVLGVVVTMLPTRGRAGYANDVYGFDYRPLADEPSGRRRRATSPAKSLSPRKVQP
ncbi:polysaccharide biosynthesis tyrosine autokinase [Frondihabitans sp. PAMC 28766]|uniref:polysaccharide biosynthesis tyrosine autokinase n=1 Tax=Frondihabitans sp. PAMC 28766 TaxID=1795630 RepID=UPI0009E793B5|nr:polysaccharide biosynthesis tyrosine autokinase [Frondihabitans sp. PAMC 28766]